MNTTTTPKWKALEDDDFAQRPKGHEVAISLRWRGSSPLHFPSFSPGREGRRQLFRQVLHTIYRDTFGGHPPPARCKREEREEIE